MRRWSWVSEIFAPAGEAVMEAAWFYAWVMVLTPPNPPTQHSVRWSR